MIKLSVVPTGHSKHIYIFFTNDVNYEYLKLCKQFYSVITDPNFGNPIARNINLLNSLKQLQV
jgi:hypothetical protein